MNDIFETTLRKTLNSGASADEVYKRLNEVLDTIAAEEKQKADKKKNERAEKVREYQHRFELHRLKSMLGQTDIAALAVMVFEKEHPEWMVQDIDEFAEMVEDTIRMLAKTVGKSNAEIGKILMNDLKEKMDEAVQEHPLPKINGFKTFPIPDGAAIDKFMEELGIK